jgi:hypothetical protein
MNIDPAHYGNAVSIGIEQEHIDGKDDWPDAQVRRSAAFVAHLLQAHPNLTLNNVLGHSDVAPEHKQDPVDYPWAKFQQYVAGFMGGEVAGTPHHGKYAGASEATTPMVASTTQRAPVTAGPDAETRRRTGAASVANILKEEGPSGTQGPEIFGFRGDEPEYTALKAARDSGNEAELHRIAAQGLVNRAIQAGSQQFSDPAIKAQVMSLAHMRGVSGGRAILNAIGTGRLDNSGSVEQLDPEAVKAINSMGRAEFMRRAEIARAVYDKVVHGAAYWERFGRGLSARYAREREFYTNLS